MPEKTAPGSSEYYRDTFEASSTSRPGLPALNVPALPVLAGSQLVNEAEGAQAERQWKSDEGPVAQTTDVNCGEASLAQVKKAKDAKVAPASDDQKREEVRSTTAAASKAVQDRFEVNLDDGARPEEMGAMLGSMGIAVTRGMSNYDPAAISEGLKSGQMGMAMVDSTALTNSLLPDGQKKQETGALHWVTIDGYNKGELSNDPMDDKFRVKDSVNGSYWVSARDLLGAMDAARLKHNGTGGMMLIENRPNATQEEREALSRSNLDQTANLGNGTGIGSRRLGAGEAS
ncbi:hypothetical protein [Hyalangium rubrum]|uniref:Peptidase C39-like domain-containing protein n=1 Tax=Hyalangium rubrum TaxID=3103134 RepID=A0ABU5HFN7_9BACT|nr:hypothetical protein [Hyalangium sp. s54d21]MDY7232283.1 hypothetical protein [Hyalangium sp. s54d21]